MRGKVKKFKVTESSNDLFEITPSNSVKDESKSGKEIKLFLGIPNFGLESDTFYDLTILRKLNRFQCLFNQLSPWFVFV